MVNSVTHMTNISYPCFWQPLAADEPSSRKRPAKMLSIDAVMIVVSERTRDISSTLFTLHITPQNKKMFLFECHILL